MIPNTNVRFNSNDEFDINICDLHRFVELGKLSANLLHEISSPLAAALLRLEDVEGQQPQNIRAIHRSLIHLKHYVNAARKQLNNQSAITNFYIDAQVREVKRVVNPLAKTSNVRLIFVNVPHIKILGSPFMFQQVLVNLIVNAIEAYPHDLRVGLNRMVKIDFKFNKRYVIIKVIDWGEGITPEQVPKLFDQFYSTKMNTGNGLGIGLGIVKRHVTEVFNGKIDVVSTPKLGTRFTVMLPLSSL